MLEYFQHEMLNELSKWELSTIAVGLFLGVPKDALTKTVTLLRQELEDRFSHKAYMLKFITSKLRSKLEDLKKVKNLLERVSEMANAS